MNEIQELQSLNKKFTALYIERFGGDKWTSVSPDSNLGRRLSDHPEFARWEQLYGDAVQRAHAGYSRY